MTGVEADDAGRSGPEPVEIPVETDEPAQVGAEDAVEESGRRLHGAVEWGLIVAGALLAALVVKTFLLQAFFIPSLSMYPTLDKGDRVLVNKLSYDLHDVNRGDLVVFERPPNLPELSVRDLIKRVVALEGETIESRGGVVYVNGRVLHEGYLPDGVTTENLVRQTVPDGHVFVMGDNRANSEDSRIFGPIPDDLIVGRAFVRVWPIFDFGLL